IACHRSASFPPSSGSRATHSGGPASTYVTNDRDHVTMSSERSATPMTAVASGAAMITSITTGMMTTARLRLPQSPPCPAGQVGHGEPTIIGAQIPASRNGRSTQKLASASPPMVSTPRTTRVRSQGRGIGLGIFMAPPLGSRRRIEPPTVGRDLSVGLGRSPRAGLVLVDRQIAVHDRIDDPPRLLDIVAARQAGGGAPHRLETQPTG